MTVAIAAAGTGGHVYPGLAVGEALVDLGFDRAEILYVGGERLEARVYPDEGFPFLSVELAGLQRRLTPTNLRIPAVVRKAVARISEELRAREIRAVLGMGGYVTVPAGLAARRLRIPLAVSEQNASAGLANRLMSFRARRVFSAFPHTHGLRRAEWVGNPIRHHLAHFDRAGLRPEALSRWDLDGSVPVLGVVGGSLGAAVLNRAVMAMMAGWAGPPIQILHLAGAGVGEVERHASVSSHRWVVLDFSHEMDLFYAACDVVVARAGGSVAELTATATPSILIPGGFGSGGHQDANAAYLADAGAAIVLGEDEVETLGRAVSQLMTEPSRRVDMARACSVLARPHAAEAIARALVEMAETR